MSSFSAAKGCLSLLDFKCSLAAKKNQIKKKKIKRNILRIRSLDERKEEMVDVLRFSFTVAQTI